MTTKLRTLAIAVSLMLIGFSCSKDKKDGVPFSKESVEENKQVVENSAIELANTMDAMKEVETVDAAANLGTLFSDANPFEENVSKSSKVSHVVNAVAGLKNGSKSIHILFDAMKSTSELEEDPETLQEAWEELVGVYSWNPSIEDWEKTANSTKIEFLFPSTENGTSNNARLTVDNYKGIVKENPVEDYEGDLPVSLDMELVVGNATLMTYTFAAEYNADGVPSKVASDLTIEDFAFSIDITNNSKEVSANYKFTHDSKTVMEVGGGINGDFSQENIDANTETHTETYTWTDWVYNEVTQEYEEVERTEVDEWTEVHMEEVIQKANAKFQIFNIALKGTVNIKSLVNETDALYPEDYWEDPNFDEEKAAEKEAEITNKYVDLYAMNVKENEKIAEAEAYMVVDQGDYYTDYYVDFRLKFGDGSLVDLETYFEEGFEDFIDQVNEMINDLNGEYELDIDPIEY